jgi:hypothetical protein
MSDPGLHFKKKKEVLEWFEKNIPESYTEYLAVKEQVKNSRFSGSTRLLNKETRDETLENFLSFLTELNLANLFLRKGVTDLSYEPNGYPGVDFSFRKVLLSVKSIQTKNYQRTEQDFIEKLKQEGGGKGTLQHKSFSDTHIEVEKNEMGTFTYTRLETGHSGQLDSDVAQMSVPMKYIGEFEEQSNIEGYKKVMFTLSYTSEFRPYHAIDIGLWYFDALPKNYLRIFRSDPSWYLKLMCKEKKQNSIDALIFMFPPQPLIWPESSLAEVVQKEPRLRVYSRDDDLLNLLKVVFS